MFRGWIWRLNSCFWFYDCLNLSLFCIFFPSTNHNSSTFPRWPCSSGNVNCLVLTCKKETQLAPVKPILWHTGNLGLVRFGKYLNFNLSQAGHSLSKQVWTGTDGCDSQVCLKHSSHVSDRFLFVCFFPQVSSTITGWKKRVRAETKKAQHGILALEPNT